MLGVNTIVQTSAMAHHQRVARLRKSQEALNRGEINPRQFVLQQWQDYYAPEEIKEQMLAWGGESNGISFSNPTAFAIEYGAPASPMPRRIQAMCGVSRKCVLCVREEPERVNQPGLRGGAKTTELRTSAPSQTPIAIEEREYMNKLQDPQNQQQLAVILDELQQYNSARPWSSQGRQSSVNEVFQLCEVDANGQKWQRFSITSARVPFFSTTLGGIVLWFGVVNVTYIASQVGKKWWLSLFHSGGGAQLGSGSDQLGEIGSNKQLDDDVLPRETIQLVDPVVRGAPASDAVLRVLRAFREKTLSWDGAVAMLAAYHGKTEEEATALLGRKPRR